MTIAPPDDRTPGRSRDEHHLAVQRFLQPDDVTCGPTCLRKVYHFYGLDIPVEAVAGEIDRNEDGGTLAVFLGISALQRGYGARIFAYDLNLFDPTWCTLPMREVSKKIQARMPHLRTAKAMRAAGAYRRFLEMGGVLGCEELTPGLLKQIINRDHPVLVGLSATHLYRMPRERQIEGTEQLVDDDVAGEPTGHFVVISGYRRWGREFSVLDPSEHAPVAPDGRLWVDAQRLTNSILVGLLTSDAVLLEIWPESGVRA